jgi:hypothetical protein
MGLRKKAPVELGKKYRDKLTGYEGVATSKTEFIYGCTRIGLETLSGGEVKTSTFDEPSLELAEEKPVVAVPARKTGGARPSVPRTGH